MNKSRLGRVFPPFSVRRACWTTGLIATIVGAIPPAASLAGDPGRQPNILWIMSEDNSKHYLRHFDPDGAVAPAIEALAKHGANFAHQR